MCGRFELHSAFEIIARLFGLTGGSFVMTAGYNIAPGRDIAIIKHEGGENRLSLCRWGFVPSWCRDLKDGYRLINARAETVAEAELQRGLQQHAVPGRGGRVLRMEA